MKRRKNNIKKVIKKRIEYSNTINKKDRENNPQIISNKVNSRDYERIYGQKNVNIKNINDKLISNYSSIIPIINREPISIIITAYQTQDYIEECLDSIENQTYFINNDNYEILVGVDGCQDTLNKLLGIRNKYRNLRIFMMNKNVGTFITSNTLINIMNYDHYIRFDSDDIMLPEMINEIMTYSNNYDVIMFSYYNFRCNGQYKLKSTGNKYAAGVIYFNKRVFEIYGGYQPWICTAEGEILKRIGDDLSIKKIDLGLFKRRIHVGGLTQNHNTGMYSNIRKKYHEMINENVKNNIKFIKRVVTEFYEKK